MSQSKKCVSYDELLDRKMGRTKFNYPSNEKLDAMTDEEYERFVRDYTDWHSKNWPGCTLAIPRRMTLEERNQRDEEFRDIDDDAIDLT